MDSRIYIYTSSNTGYFYTTKVYSDISIQRKKHLTMRIENHEHKRDKLN